MSPGALTRRIGALLKRRQAAKKSDQDWFYFSSALALALVSNYISVRLLYRKEPLTTAITILGKALDVAEKALKLFVMVCTKSSTALTSARSDYGHNIEKLRSVAANYDPVFDELMIRNFTRDLNDKAGKLYQLIRYGSEETTEGFEADVHALMPVIDRIFFQSIIKLPANDRKLLFYVSPLKHLIRGSQFDQTQDPEGVLEALRFNNVEIADFENLCRTMDIDHEALLREVKNADSEK